MECAGVRLSEYKRARATSFASYFIPSDIMKLLLVTVLLLLCSTQVVHTIRCYSCTGGDICENLVDCPADEPWCKVETTEGTEVVIRGCASAATCASENDNITCCNESECNSS
ncbi:lymphocyte antigen 6D [Cheilinus undulatus]|uniref:lymphocyte antigen 6D n=1 Tax=Cheilinus undulatus TaxID=241271 RepID=UPI001BD6500D|nr:lymphocyte antigen 6D [Cheilinus undulatus]